MNGAVTSALFFKYVYSVFQQCIYTTNAIKMVMNEYAMVEWTGANIVYLESF